jgi:hypothetical protein
VLTTSARTKLTPALSVPQHSVLGPGGQHMSHR